MGHDKPMEFTDFLQEKYRKFFRFLDVSKTGNISAKTFNQIEENVRKTRKADDKGITGSREDVLKWWSPLEVLTDDGRLDEARFMAVMQFVYSDPDEFETFQLNCESGFSLSFNSITGNNSSDTITQSDLRTCYKWFGITDQNFSDRVFVALDTDSDGLVSRKEYLEALHKYFFSNDRHVGCHFLFGG